MHQSNRTPFAAALLRVPDPFGQLRHAGQRPLEPGVLGIFRDHDDANLFLRNRRDIGLRAFTPVDFNVVLPGPHAIVASRGEALPAKTAGLQSAPSPDSRAASIGSQNPARGQNPSGSGKNALG